MLYSHSSRFQAVLAVGFALLIASLAVTPASASAGTLAPAESPAEFTLQLGTFSSIELAQASASALEGAWIRVIQREGRTLYRVNYGRFTTRAQALQVRWNLEERGFSPAIELIFA